MQRLGSITLTTAAAAGIIAGGVVAASHSGAQSAATRAPLVVASAKPTHGDPQLAALRHEAQVLAAQIAAARAAQVSRPTVGSSTQAVVVVTRTSQRSVARTVSTHVTSSHGSTGRPKETPTTVPATSTPSTTTTTWVDDNTSGGNGGDTNGDGGTGSVTTTTSPGSGSGSGTGQGTGDGGGDNGSGDHATKSVAGQGASHG